MFYLKLANHPATQIDKPYFTVGIGSNYDLNLFGAGDKILYSVHDRNSELNLIPSADMVSINGKQITNVTPLKAGDRIECRGYIANLIASPLLPADAERERQSSALFALIHSLAFQIDTHDQFDQTLTQALSLIVKFSGAEVGYLLCEKQPVSDWELLGRYGEGTHAINKNEQSRSLVSNTILEQAIRSREPVYIESVIGHPLSDKESVMGSRLFSVLCIPLKLGERIFGALYLYTRTPGRSIIKESLKELGIIASHFALLLSTRKELGKIKGEVKRLRSQTDSSDRTLIFDSKNPKSTMAALYRRLGKIAQSELSVLVRGETGTGKEMIAREIHKQSTRNAGPFVAINCASIPPSLLESTLFGYRKGAFTGAQKDSPGKFLQAHGGTLFLDEIGDLPLDLQVKLLRVLQEKELEPVGADKNVPVDFRIVAATHQPLEQWVNDGKFRKDLFFRLNGVAIQIPSLTHRPEDLLLLANHFLNAHSPDLSLSAEAQQMLLEHSWPGNVRELQQVISRAAVLCEGNVIGCGDLELGDIQTPVPSSINPLDVTATNLKDAQDALGKDLVLKALKKFEGNRSLAAKHLGVSERTLYRLIASAKGDSTEANIDPDSLQ